MNLRIALFACLVFVSGCATSPAAHKTAALTDDPAHPAAAVGWVRTELYFGIALADDPNPTRTEAKWRAFLDSEVTPRFPDGLSVFDIYGQWRSKGQAQPVRQRSKVLVVLYPDTPQHRADIDAVRAAWKRDTGDQSVLKVTQAAEVSF
jgi:hypothetical protein